MTDEEKQKEIEHARKMIDLLGKALEGTAEQAVLSYEIQTEAGKRQISKIPMKDLHKMRESYIKKLNALQGKGKKRFRKVLVKF